MDGVDGEIVVEEKTGHCWRCRQPFQPGARITLVQRRFLYKSRHDGQIRRRLSMQWGTMCPRCTTEKETRNAPHRLDCEGCGQPLAMPYVTRRVCSTRCEQRWRRRRQAERLWMVCTGCGEPFQQTRADSRFCSNKCRQAAYRQRLATGEKAEPRPEADSNDALHLDEIAGVLHYEGVPIIGIGQLRRWPGYGNRHVGRFPWDAWDARRALQAAAGCNSTRNFDHLFECLECRRWSLSRAYTFCSRRCRLAYRALEARERRA